MVIVIVLWFGGRLVLDPHSGLNAAAFIAYLGIFSQILNPAKAITTAFYNISKGAASVDRIQAVLNAQEIIEEKPDAISINSFKESIEYRNLWFKYEEKDVLKNINLTISRGKTIALVGASGSGKSTMADLLPRFYDPQTGGVFIDGD